MEEQLETEGDTTLLEGSILEEHVRRDDLLLERAGYTNKEVHLRFLLELIEMLEPITGFTPSFDGRTGDGGGGRVTVKRWNMRQARALMKMSFLIYEAKVSERCDRGWPGGRI